MVTVTVASPSSRSSGPRWVSTVCTRLIGATRLSWVNQPVRVYTASSVTSQRWTVYRHSGTPATCAAATASVIGNAAVCQTRSVESERVHTTSAIRTISQPIAAGIAQSVFARGLGRHAGSARTVRSGEICCRLIAPPSAIPPYCMKSDGRVRTVAAGSCGPESAVRPDRFAPNPDPPE